MRKYNKRDIVKWKQPLNTLEISDVMVVMEDTDGPFVEVRHIDGGTHHVAGNSIKKVGEAYEEETDASIKNRFKLK